MVGDYNAELGKDVIGGDVHPMSPNCKLLFSLCNKYNLFVLNSSNLCKGVFTCIHNYRNKVKVCFGVCIDLSGFVPSVCFNAYR